MNHPGLSSATLHARTALRDLCHAYHQRGWMLGTSGNLSAQVDGRVVITASGRHKGRMTIDDFVEIAIDGTPVAAGLNARPSAETSIHTEVYRARPATGCVLHVHTVASTLAGMRGLATDDRALDFQGLEMVKGWGLWAPGAAASLPCFENHTHVPDIATEIGQHLEGRPAEGEVPALLIAAHGITAWGADIDAAHRHVEVTEFLCQLAIAR